MLVVMLRKLKKKVLVIIDCFSLNFIYIFKLDKYLTRPLYLNVNFKIPSGLLLISTK